MGIAALTMSPCARARDRPTAPGRALRPSPDMPAAACPRSSRPGATRTHVTPVARRSARAWTRSVEMTAVAVPVVGARPVQSATFLVHASARARALERRAEMTDVGMSVESAIPDSSASPGCARAPAHPIVLARAVVTMAAEGAVVSVPPIRCARPRALACSGVSPSAQAWCVAMMVAAAPAVPA